MMLLYLVTLSAFFSYGLFFVEAVKGYRSGEICKRPHPAKVKLKWQAKR